MTLLEKKQHRNLEDFLNYVNSVPVKFLGSSVKNGADFSGSDNLSHTFKIAREGFDLEKINLAVQSVRENANTSHIEAVESVSGSVVNMHNYLEGIPEDMIDFPLTDNTKFLDLIVDIGELADKGVNVFVNKAIAAACFVDHMENNGYRVRVIAASLQKFAVEGYQYNEFILSTVVVKDYQEPLSVGQVAGCLHPGFFRRAHFAVWENYFHSRGKSVPFGYGRQVDSQKELDFCLKELGEGKEAMFLPNSSFCYEVDRRSFNLYSLEGAKQWVEFYAAKHNRNAQS